MTQNFPDTAERWRGDTTALAHLDRWNADRLISPPMPGPTLRIMIIRAGFVVAVLFSIAMITSGAL